ncbi:unnamed protein product, partial [Diplocarpon coronariae]
FDQEVIQESKRFVKDDA